MKSKIDNPSTSELAKQYQKKYARMSKKAGVFIILLILASCGSKKSSTALSASLTSACPIDGNCKVEVFDKKSMVVKTTETGGLHYELEESTSRKVVKYTYNRKVKGDIQDASYREEIVFEINSNLEESAFVDESLQDAQLLFGRFCYCKGQTGYYKIDNGSLRISKNKEMKTTQINLAFKTNKVPQIIEAIAIALK
jgi:hypothetical protein